MIFVWELLFLTFIIATDLISKELICPFLLEQPGEMYVILDKIFTFRYVENTGASFGSFAGNQAMLIGVTTIVMIGIVALLIWQKDAPKFLRCSLLMILGGGIGNLVDRVAFSYVRDFIDYTFLDTFFGIKFAIGNVADIYLVVGVMMVIVYVFFAYSEKDFSKKWKSKVKYE